MSGLFRGRLRVGLSGTRRIGGVLSVGGPFRILGWCDGLRRFGRRLQLSFGSLLGNVCLLIEADLEHETVFTGTASLGVATGVDILSYHVGRREGRRGQPARPNPLMFAAVVDDSEVGRLGMHAGLLAGLLDVLRRGGGLMMPYRWPRPNQAGRHSTDTWLLALFH